MEKRTVTFLVASVAVLMLWMGFIQPMFFPVQQKIAPVKDKPVARQKEADPPPVEAPQGPEAEREPEEKDQFVADEPEPAQAEPEEKLVAAPKRESVALAENIQLGSLNSDDGFLLRLTLTNRGGAIHSIETTEYLAEDRKTPLKLIDGALSRHMDSFLLFTFDNNDDLEHDLALRKWQWQVTDVFTTHEGQEFPIEVEFSTTLDDRNGLGVVKRYRLDPETYTIGLVIEWRLPKSAERTEFKYRLATANGLPLEGKEYAMRFREAVVLGALEDGETTERHSWRADQIIDEVQEKERPDGTGDPFSEQRIRFAGVDAQFFAVVIVPRQTEDEPWIASGNTFLVEEDRKDKRFSDITYELTSTRFPIQPGDDPTIHEYTIFAGPKRPELLAKAVPGSGLENVLNWDLGFPLFGWLGSFLSPLMVQLLKFFHGIVGNWGLAILMLTIMVRLILFPLSRKQALSAQRMQEKFKEMKPEMDALKEKHKKNPQKMQQAQMELWRKHKFNPLAPLAGCLPMLLQMPIFIGLFAGLRLAIDLRQAPLIPGLWWCADLSAPDHLFRFPGFIMAILDAIHQLPLIGWLLNLGSYFNLLPILTVVIFVIQQKLFMPPPTDEQSAMQQKMMNRVMMPMFGLMFYKVPSGLCLYFIVSSLWGIAERKLLPKKKDKQPAPSKNASSKSKGRPMSGARGRR